MKVMGYNATVRPLHRNNGDVYCIEVEGQIVGRYLDHPFTVHCDLDLHWDASCPATIANITDSIQTQFNKATSPERQVELDRSCNVPRFTVWEGKRGLYTTEVRFFLPETAPDDVLIERGKQIVDGLIDDGVCLNIMFDKERNDDVTVEGDDVIVDVPSCDLKVTFKGGLTQERRAYFIEHISAFVNDGFEYEDITIEYPEPSEINAFTCHPLTRVVELVDAFMFNKAVAEHYKKVL